jgi:hypothetical protein
MFPPMEMDEHREERAKILSRMTELERILASEA